MGCSSSSEGGGRGAAGPGSEEEVKQSRSIDKILREEEKRLAREVKVSRCFARTLCREVRKAPMMEESHLSALYVCVSESNLRRRKISC